MNTVDQFNALQHVSMRRFNAFHRLTGLSPLTLRESGQTRPLLANALARIRRNVLHNGFGKSLETLLSQMMSSQVCQNCGAPLPEGVLQGLCGRCLAQLALGEESVAGSVAVSPAGHQAESNRYEVQSKIAQGGMGEVLEARDLHFGRSVAMKIIRSERDPTHEMRLRFVQEARILSQLEHPNIVPVHDLDKDEQGRVFYTMKKVQGLTLKEIINRLKTGDPEAVAKYPLSQLLTIFQKVCDAVGFAHSKGIVHRDLKPENIMLGEYGEVLVMDWGLAKVLRGSAGAPPASSGASPDGSKEGFQEVDDLRPPAGDGGHDLTLEGTVMGTPQFMAPEQAEGRIADIDERTDIFSLGGILYSLLTLRPPTGGTTVREVLANIKTGYIPPPIFYNKARRLAADGTELEGAILLAHCSGGRIPDSLSAVTMKAMAVEPAERYQTVQELQAEIVAHQGGFATSAEQAGTFRQLWLLVLRHKGMFCISALAMAIVLALGLGLGIKIIRERNRANATLADLRKTVPLMRAEIDSLMAAHKFQEALSKVEYLCTLLPDEAENFVLKGNLLQTLLRFEEAGRAYQEALRLSPSTEFAGENVNLCRKLALTAGKSRQMHEEDFQTLQSTMNKQGRYAEASAMLQHMGTNRQSLLESVKQTIGKAGVEKRLVDQIEMDTEGLLHWRINEPLPLNDLTVLKGMPFKEIATGETKASDLSPLKGMPLETLWVQANHGTNSWPTLLDISALKGMRLKSLNLTGSGISSLEPLKGMPLERCAISYTAISDLSPLAGVPLVELGIQVCPNLKDISPIKGCPIVSLRMEGTPGVSDLSPLQGMPLRTFYFSGFSESHLKDISPLADSPLEDLMLVAPRIKDISVLRGKPLRKAAIGGPLITDISALSDCPLEELDISQCVNLRDIRPLLRCQNLKLLSIPAAAQNVEQLRNMSSLEKLCFLQVEDWKKIPPISEFWEAYDAKKHKK